VAQRLVIDNPVAFTPSPYGIFSVAIPATPTKIGDSRHWQLGVTYQANCLLTNTTYDECISVTGTSSPVEPPTKEADTHFITRGSLPFTVYAEFSCSPVGSDVATLARDALARRASWQAENAFFTGVVGGQNLVFPHLAHDTDVYDINGVLLQSAVVTGAASDVATALGFLEDQIATCYGGRGVIHMARDVLPTFDAHGLLRQTGGKLTTLGGNLVVAGDGYTGDAPDGTPASTGQSWVYATGMIFEMHSDPRVTGMPDSFDRSENTMTYIAEQTFVLGWDCCHFGVPVVLGADTEAVSSDAEYSIVTDVDTTGQMLLPADSTRQRVTILSLDENIVLSDSFAGLATGATWLVNVPVVIEAGDQVWAKAAINTTDISVIVERWA
jgi:hypothetical protein